MKTGSVQASALTQCSVQCAGIDGWSTSFQVSQQTGLPVDMSKLFFSLISFLLRGSVESIRQLLRRQVES